MGGHEGWPQPSGLMMLNGLLPIESTSVTRVLRGERWSKAEERTAELIDCIQPNQPSEQRRNAVADYVQRLIMRCFPCQVFTFGSVPLKTYLPDGDIDLTAFSKSQTLKDTWASQVRDILESEEKNENAEFRVKEVQYIQAEVKIIKCLVENIVVDISFNQLGGLCTLCFLEEVDHKISKNHLFKRSIILIKAWCYYESRILGAHHGLISTYALETLVLYIFNVFNNSFTGPLEVLYRFLEFFSNFDWDNFCLSLWGPVPISSLPDMIGMENPDTIAEPPRKDKHIDELPLNSSFLRSCSSAYAVIPGFKETRTQPFISKNFNVIDPLRVNNNLGRSVSKGNFYRIRSAFAFGAKRLARLVDCPKENIAFELNQFFMNTWERHGNGIRPDAPVKDLLHLVPSNRDHASDNHRNASSSKKTDENASIHDIEVEGLGSTPSLSSQRTSYKLQSASRSNDVPAASLSQGQKSYSNPISSRVSSQTEKSNSNPSLQSERSLRNVKLDHMVNEIQGKHLFARTRSSPELTDAYCDASSRARSNKPSESGETQSAASGKTDGSRRKNVASETVSTQSTVSSSDDLSSGRHVAADSFSVTNSYIDDPGTSKVTDDHASMMGVQVMHQQEQDLVNIMASSSVHKFGGQLPFPMNLASSHLPLPVQQSMLASMGYGPRGMAGIVPTNIPMLDPHWATNLQFHQGFMSSPLTQYFPGVGLSTNSEDLVQQGRDCDTEYWHERDAASNEGFGPDEGSSEIMHTDDRQPSTSANSDFVPSSRMTTSGNALKTQQKFVEEGRGSTRDDYVETFQHQDNRVSDVNPDDRVSGTMFSSVSQSGSVRSKTSSESSWDGSSARTLKVGRDKRGRKSMASAAAPPHVHGKGKGTYESVSADADDESSDWNGVSTMGNETDERSTVSKPSSALQVSRHHLPGFEGSQTSGSDSLVPIGPMLLGPGSRQRVMDNSGAVPLAFYPTGPPVPFFMLPVYNYPTESGTSESSSSHLGGEEGPDNSDSGQNLDSSETQEAPGVLNTYDPIQRVPAMVEPKRDILNSDFTSHWYNLQYGRFCQSPQYAVCPSPVVAPMSLHGRFPWDGPGRPLAGNMNILPQIVSYGPRIVPVAPAQSMPNRPTTVYQRYVDEIPRYRSGTGTYLPNPKPSVRDRHSSGTRRNSYNNYDRSDHSDREGNWNVAKSRAAARNHNRNNEKSRIDRLAANESRAERSWATYRNDAMPPFQAQNGPVRPSSSQSSSINMAAYGMYPLQSGVASNGPNSPSIVMLYPFDQNSGYVSPGEQLEFGSLGPVNFVGMTDASQPGDAAHVRGPFEDQRSPDQPSSPHFQRSVAQRKYQLKDEDFPPLEFQSHGGDSGGSCNEKHSPHQTLVYASQA